MLVNKICPNCGTEQKGLNLKETNGSFVCSKCKRPFVVDGDAKEGYFYGCCPYCKTPLTQGKNGTDSYNLCPTCGSYIQVIIEGKRVIVEPKED